MTPEIKLASVRREQEGNQSIKDAMKHIFDGTENAKTQIFTERAADSAMTTAFQDMLAAQSRFNDTLYHRSQQLTDESLMLRNVIKTLEGDA